METSNQRVKQVRKELKLTQKEFSEALGYNQAYCSEIERGIKDPTAKIIERLFAQFKVSSDWLINGIGDIFITNGGVNNSGLEDSKVSGFSGESDMYDEPIDTPEIKIARKGYDDAYELYTSIERSDIDVKNAIDEIEECNALQLNINSIIGKNGLNLSSNAIHLIAQTIVNKELTEDMKADILKSFAPAVLIAPLVKSFNEKQEVFLEELEALLNGNQK